MAKRRNPLAEAHQTNRDLRNRIFELERDLTSREDAKCQALVRQHQELLDRFERITAELSTHRRLNASLAEFIARTLASGKEST